MRQSDRGSVLVIALIVVVFMGVLVAAFVSVTATELLIAANFRHTQGALAAGDAVAERAMIDLASMADWNQVLAGAIRSTFVDGSPLGTRVLPGGQVVSLPGIANLANCRLRTACSAAAMDAVTTARPRGPNNPRWQLYAYGRLEDVLPGVVVGLPYYAVVLVGDDPSENDNDPLRDSAPEQPGSGVIALHVEVFGPRSVHKVIELTVRRAMGGGVRPISWHELR